MCVLDASIANQIIYDKVSMTDPLNVYYYSFSFWMKVAGPSADGVTDFAVFRLTHNRYDVTPTSLSGTLHSVSLKLSSPSYIQLEFSRSPSTPLVTK
jgi:hypothetical protein